MNIKNIINIKERKISGKKLFLIIIVLCVAAAAVAAAVRAHETEDEISYTETAAALTDMKVTLTAVGEIKGSESETIDFSTSKKFDGMCVEENENVVEGQKLIKYTDGTYETAGYNGVITNIAAPEAGTVGDDKNSITLSRTEELSLDITVPEDQINLVKEGSSASIVVNSDSSKSFEGTITGLKAMSTTLISEKANSNASGSGMSGFSMGNRADPFGLESSTSYYTVSLKFTNDGTILTGMSANCTVTLSERKDVLAVPVEAVYFDSDGKAYVYKGGVNSAVRTDVEIGGSDAENVEITKGLEAGDIIRVEVQK